jgi:hypothetical protein
VVELGDVRIAKYHARHVSLAKRWTLRA